jgi:hypothetical protein
MTLKTDKTVINDKPLSELNSAEVTEVVTALLAHRKTLNEAKRSETAAAKAARAEKAAARKVERAAKLREQLAKLEAAA